MPMTARIVGCCVALLANLLVPMSGRAEEAGTQGGCLPLFFDQTPPELAKALEKVIWIPVAAPEVTYAGDKKVVQQRFIFADPEVDTLPCADEDCGSGSLKCTSTCVGNGCQINGCDIFGSSCTACSCFGCSAQCTCTKEVT